MIRTNGKQIKGRYEELLLEAGLEELVFGLTEREEERDETIPL